MMQKTRNMGQMPAQGWRGNVSTSPTMHARTSRMHYLRTLSSMKPGKMHPVGFIGMHREDSMRTSRVRVAFDMAQTADLLLNNVRVVVQAHFVPKLAQERFRSIEDLDRAHAKEAGAPDLYVERPGFAGKPGEDTILYAAGLHVRPDKPFNDDYIRAYNIVWNHRAKNRSVSLELVDEDQDDLLPAFWPATVHKHIKPTFDQAMVDGQVPLDVVGGSLPVRGIGYHGPEGQDTPAQNVREATGQTRDYAHSRELSQQNAAFELDAAGAFPQIFAELADQSVMLSLANFEMAKKTVAWARMRAQYQGLPEDWMMDQLLSGISIPHQYLQQPLLIDQKETIMGMQQRYATDGDNLETSVADGATFVDLTLRVPQMVTGGTVVITAEIVPEQIPERIEDPFLQVIDAEKLPDRMRDELDPEKVSVVENGFVEVGHDQASDVFGYAPLNHEWQVNSPRLGGKFYRQQGDDWSQERNRIWTPEIENPVLTRNFYLAEDLKWDVFVDTASDPFEVNANGLTMIDGLTYFGESLREAEGHYEHIMSRIPQDRVPMPPSLKKDEEDEG